MSNADVLRELLLKTGDRATEHVCRTLIRPDCGIDLRP